MLTDPKDLSRVFSWSSWPCLACRAIIWAIIGEAWGGLNAACHATDASMACDFSTHCALSSKCKASYFRGHEGALCGKSNPWSHWCEVSWSVACCHCAGWKLQYALPSHINWSTAGSCRHTQWPCCNLSFGRWAFKMYLHRHTCTATWFVAISGSRGFATRSPSWAQSQRDGEPTEKDFKHHCITGATT